jgi:DNA-binding NarL/FixJ family response regulator
MIANMSSPVAIPIRVMIVEDDRSTREGLANLIGGTHGHELAGHFRSVEEGLASTVRPDVLLLDIQLPGMKGSDAIPYFLERWPAVRIVMLTVFEGSNHVFESICSGACGYLLKKTPPSKLLEAIADAHQGGAPMTPAIAAEVVRLFREFAPAPKAASELTGREHEVLTLLAEGYSYTRIASNMGITANTVRNHIRTIYEKLHVHSRSEAVSKALRSRLI